MNNRRNHYRTLHVQPEAPIEIIKASYRSLMTKLKAHPDLGGNHETAAQINLAYAVLSDPQKRRKYDEHLLSQRSKAGLGARARAYANGTACGGNTDRLHPDTTKELCLFCGAKPAAASKECGVCFSPLSPVKSAPAHLRYELFGRRKGPRIAKTATVKLYPSWPHSGHVARLNDLSAAGLSLSAPYSLKTGQIVKLESDFLKGIARVVTIRSQGSFFSVHLTLLTAEFLSHTGTFIREKA